MRAIVLLATTFVLSVVSVAPRAQSDEVRAAIEATNRKFEAAWAKKDAAAVAELYTADALAMPPNGPVAKGAQAILDMWKAALPTVPGPIRLITLETSTHGDVAHEVGTYVMWGPDGKIVDNGKFVVLWKKEGGQWKLHRDIWNSDMPPAR
jgi:uncharacterized protein (TIGR02246 family)